MGVGDELMATGDAATLFAETGKKVLILDRNDRPRWHELFRGNPKIWLPQKWVGRQSDHPFVRSGPGRRPYADYEAIEALGKRLAPHVTDRKELRRAASRLRFNFDYHVCAGELHFDESEIRFGKQATEALGSFVIVEPGIKGRVPAKQWGIPNWQKLATMLHKAGKKPVQIGIGSGHRLKDVRYIRTPTFRYAMSVMDRCSGFVVPEGGMHHAMGTLHKKGVALFAGRTPLTLSYPEQMTWYIEHKGGACGMEHVDCPDCRTLWRYLAPGQVFEMLARICD